MSANAIALTTWSVEYYQTMAAAEQARLEVAKGIENFFGHVVLWQRLKTVTNDTEKLIHALSQVESKPASILLEPGAEKIPESLRDLFRTMCDVLQKSEAEGLHKTLLLRKIIVRIGEQSQEVSGFADRYEDAQKKLRSRVSPEEAVHYRDAFRAYGQCAPVPEEATDDDVKRELLHF
jgi:hypothetical protein